MFIPLETANCIRHLSLLVAKAVSETGHWPDHRWFFVCNITGGCVGISPYCDAAICGGTGMPCTSDDASIVVFFCVSSVPSGY